MSTKKKLKGDPKKTEPDTFDPIREGNVSKAKELRQRYQDNCIRLAASPLSCFLKKIDAVIEKADALKQLILANENLRPNDISSLRVSFKEYPHLQSICIWNTPLDVYALSTLFEFAQSKPTVSRLQLHQNGISSQHSTALVRFGATCSHLNYLSLDHNSLETSANELMFALAQNPKCCIKKLSLRYCSISPDISENLCGLVGNSNTLTAIDLSGNMIGDRGLLGLSMALERNKTLAFLNLAFNEIEDIAVDGHLWPFEELCQSIGLINTSLCKLDLTGNFIGNHGMLKVFQMVQNRKSIYSASKAGPFQCLVPERVSGGLFDLVWEMNNAMDPNSSGKKKKKAKKK